MRRYVPNHYSIVLHEHAKGDLDELFNTNRDVAAAIAVFLDEVAGNQLMLDNLSRNGYVGEEDPKFDVGEWVEQKRAKRNLWRLKLWALRGAKDLRVIYAFHPTELRYYVLGIVSRDFDYDNNHEVTKRIIADYDEIGIPGY